MKGLLWLGIVLAAVVGILMPLGYLYVSSKLPPLGSEFELERQLKHSIEGERLSARAGQSAPNDRSHVYVRPELAHWPADLVSLYLVNQGCPHYLGAPREEGLSWGWRLVVAAATGTSLAGDGRCERAFGMRIAHALGISGTLELTVAAHKLHRLLRRDQLIAYDLSALYFDRGLVGIDDASSLLFARPPGKLAFAELAELTLVLPPYFLFDDLRICRNPVALRQSRDSVIADAGSAALFPEKLLRAAPQQALACTR